MEVTGTIFPLYLCPLPFLHNCVLLTWSGRTDAKGCQAYPEIFASCWHRVGSPQVWLNARSEVGLEFHSA